MWVRVPYSSAHIIRERKGSVLGTSDQLTTSIDSIGNGAGEESSDELSQRAWALFEWLKYRGYPADYTTLRKALRRLNGHIMHSEELTQLVKDLPEDQRTPANGSSLPQNAALYDALVTRFGGRWTVKNGMVKLPCITASGYVLPLGVALVIPIELTDERCRRRQKELDKALESMGV